MSRVGTLVRWLLMLGALTSGCELPGKPDSAQREVRSEKILDFEELFSKNCTGCHGVDGKGGAAPPIGEPSYQAWVSDAQLRSVIRDGIAGTAMAAFAVDSGGMLTNQQIEALVAGMRARFRRERWQQPARALPPYSASTPGDVERGRTAYQTHCARCHGTDGTGGVDGGSVVDSTYLALTSDQGLRTGVVIGRPDFAMPAFRDYDEPPMAPSEVDDLVAWLASHRSPYPGQLPTDSAVTLELGTSSAHEGEESR